MKTRKASYFLWSKLFFTLFLFELISLSNPVKAQYAVRDEFPNGQLRGVLYEHFTREEWDASNFAPSKAIEKWEALRYGMFIHFGITSKPENADLSWGSINPRYAPDSPGITANGNFRTEDWVNWPKEMKLENSDFLRSATGLGLMGNPFTTQGEVLGNLLVGVDRPAETIKHTFIFSINPKENLLCPLSLAELWYQPDSSPAVSR